MNTTSKTDDKVAVLSYNICFQAMTNNTTGSAGTLGAACHWVGKNLTICAQNMAGTIDGLLSSLNVSALDFVGLQEASHWGALQTEAKNSLAQMKGEGTKAHFTEMASFYNPTKYTLSHKVEGSFNRDRPFLILVCKHTFDTTGTIFINTHNPHSYTFDAVQKKLSVALAAVNLTESEKAYRIIVVGDFNETGWVWGAGGTPGHICTTHSNQKETTHKCSHQWQPLKDLKIQTSVAIKQAVFTCCQSSGDWNDGNGGVSKGSRGGDYIFDSKAPADIMLPPGYGPLTLQSDHLPVVAVL